MKTTFSICAILFALFCFIACGHYVYMTIVQYGGETYVRASIQTFCIGLMSLCSLAMLQVDL